VIRDPELVYWSTNLVSDRETRFNITARIVSGLLTCYTMGGFIPSVLVVALVASLFKIIGRR
jgi:hypothetical protein